ncbi:peptidoglycan-binding protein [Streptomyces sp. ISL-94]|uniref:peptidoglycan-binding domain-containing protein n=1 Tax=Streptomyces sp. ISL-94 TaxID=2819190 RepID=UPI001BE5BBD3|nr:peptidoglycan-binding domain-containing protein [Streptomyces sp. ISL-94]MBT2476857.1 peptidoglycan-binding protein [Streptomyces sp. ISL-94]
MKQNKRTRRVVLSVALAGVIGLSVAGTTSASAEDTAKSADHLTKAAAKPLAPVTLRQGSRGEIVKTLQGQLTQHGHRVAVDGTFGPATTAAVKDFQSEHNLTVDGAVGQKTWQALNAAPSARPSSSPSRELTHSQAVARLKAADIPFSSSGRCTEKYKRGCTSFQGVREGTLNLVLDLKQRSTCDFVITGAAEKYPHSTSGLRTHEHGYKIDIRPNACLNTFIRDHMAPGKPRGKNNDPRWTGRNAEYVLELHGRRGEHWDITYLG